MYIPNSKIDPKVYYTEGGEYYYSKGNINYVGFYHKDTYGNVWSGKEHTLESVRLVSSISSDVYINPDYNNTGTSYVYSTLNVSSYNTNIELPPNDSLPPTSEDYIQTYYTRFIIQYLLSSQPIFYEVNKNTYFTYFNGNNNQYFKFAEVLWKISGPLYDIKENGILKQGGVIDSNQRSVNTASSKIPTISNYLNNLTLYYKA